MDKGLLKRFNQVERFHWWWEGRRELLKILLTREKHQKILDIGCGTGETLTFLRKIFPRAKLTGIDLLAEAVKYTKARHHRAIVGSASRLPFPNSSFDTVLILDVIEHIEDDLAALKEARRVLSPGGIIIITAPALQLIWSAHDKNQGHWRRYDKGRFTRLAQKSGLKIEFLSYFNFFLSPPIIAIRLLSRLSPFSHLAQYDSKLNYNLAYKRPINRFLRYIFVKEIGLVQKITFPFGISLATKLRKG